MQDLNPPLAEMSERQSSQPVLGRDMLTFCESASTWSDIKTNIGINDQKHFFAKPSFRLSSYLMEEEPMSHSGGEEEGEYTGSEDHADRKSDVHVVDLEAANTLVDNGIAMWNKFPALREASTKRMASNVAKSISRSYLIDVGKSANMEVVSEDEVEEVSEEADEEASEEADEAVASEADEAEASEADEAEALEADEAEASEADEEAEASETEEVSDPTDFSRKLSPVPSSDPS
eukprot:maker-scaffold131_size323982-snap-gene-2.22 protein:Tk05553 transcript:maker-scaffold131_size323982-snap-gene-2.22-mRNA-1 annotation:"hypothetical protein YYC_05378"